ncbi:MAG: DUF1778 domain-containing protein [Acidobacteriota bacterium]|nr:DUF1778 domain-containing protein [Acidobacteriota bacterium]
MPTSVKSKVRKEAKRISRLDFRISEENKRLIEQAAIINEQTVSDFVLSITLPIARERVSQEQLTKLSNRDRDIFLALLNDESEPNEALKQDFSEYRDYLKSRSET